MNQKLSEVSDQDPMEQQPAHGHLARQLRERHLAVWAYVPATRHYHLLNDAGEYAEELNPSEFAQRFDSEGFEEMRSAVFDICDGKRDTAVATLRSHAVDDFVRNYYEVHISVVRRDANGRPTCLMGVQHDITENTLRQQEVKRLLIRYHTVFDSGLLDMLYYDKDGVLRDINERALKSFNVPSRDFVLDGSFLLENNPMYNHTPLQEMEDTRTTAIVDFGHYGDAKYHLDDFQLSGKMYYESTINPIRDEAGNLEGVYMAGRDVTEMVESFHRLQRGTRQLSELTKNLQDYVNNINYALKVSDVRMVNYYPDKYTLELMGTIGGKKMTFSQLRCIRLASPRFRRTVNSVLNRMDHRSRYPILQAIETELRDKQGRTIWMLFNFVPLTDEQGRVERYFGMCREITELVATEQQLAVESQKAQETDLLKQAFLTNMGYEIRTPLNTVVGFAELFGADHDEADEPFFVEQIKRGTQTLLELVNDILFLSQLDAKMVEVHPARVDVAQAFEGMCQLAVSQVSPDVNVIIESNYDKLEVDIDLDLVGKILERIGRMTCRYTQKGSIRFRCVYRRGELNIITEDTGMGMSKEQLPHVFDRFLHDYSGELVGTGLDMPIAKGLVEAMGGSLEVESEFRRGTTNWLTIPCEAFTVERSRDLGNNQTEQATL